MRAKHEIIWISTTDSTNDEVKRHIHDLDNLSVVSAFEQKSGRGQHDRVWTSQAGMNLTFSILLKFPSETFMAKEAAAISELTALSLVDLLSMHGISARIKWPNDIYVSDRKICGILIENSVSGAYLSHSIIGIGLNVNPVSMLGCCCPKVEKIDLMKLLEQFMRIFISYHERYLNIRGGLAKLHKMYSALLIPSSQQ